MKLIQGDCIDEMAKMDADSVDLTVTSPPYDNLRTYEGSLQWNDGIWKQVLEGLYRVTKDGGVVVWVVGDATIKGSETGTSFKQALYAMDCGFNLHDTMIYEKNQLSFPTTNRYYPSFEYMFVFSKSNPNTFNPIKDRINKTAGRAVDPSGCRNVDGTKQKMKSCHGNVTKSHGVRWNRWLMYNNSRGQHSDHPATFPEQLAHDHIISWSNEGDTVFDPFMGSGTTGKMAKQLGRKFIGVEKVADYYKIAQARIV